MQHAAIPGKDTDQALAVDFTYISVLPDHLGLLHLQHARERRHEHRRLAFANWRKPAEIGDQNGPFLEASRLRLSRDDGFSFLRSCGHLFVQLFQLRFVAQGGDHLGERAAEDSDFVAAIDVGMHAVVACGDRLRDSGEMFDGAGYALGDEPGKDERQQQRCAAAQQQGILDLLEGSELPIERTQEHRRADHVGPAHERLTGHDVRAALDVHCAGRDALAGAKNSVDILHLLHAHTRSVLRPGDDRCRRHVRRGGEHHPGGGGVCDPIGKRVVDGQRVDEVADADIVRSGADRSDRCVNQAAS